VQAIRTRLVEKYAPDTTNKILSYLRSVLREAMNLDLLSAGDFARIQSIRGARGRRVPRGRFIELEEQRALFDQLDTLTPAGTRGVAMLGLLLGAGLRRSEIVDLQLSSLRPDGALLVRGKGDKERVVPLPPAVLAAVERWVKLRGKDPGRLFLPFNKHQAILHRKKGENAHLTAQAIYGFLEEIAKSANVTNLSPHDLRRTYISSLLDNGVDLATAQSLAGHTKPETTAGYDRRGLATRKRAAEGLYVPVPER
jgi:integrase/recombinase XerD